MAQPPRRRKRVDDETFHIEGEGQGTAGTTRSLNDGNDEDEEAIGDAEKEFAAWEKSYAKERAWEDLEEDSTGRLVPAAALVEEQRRQRRSLQQEASRIGKERVRKGIIRYLVLGLDLSRAAGTMDMRPSRMAVQAKCVERFIGDFFDQNPLSHLSIITLKDGVARTLTDPSASPDTHKQAVRNALSCSGNASIQNAMELGFEILHQIPSYGHRELLLLFSSLSTCDPGSVMETILKCKGENIRCSVIGMGSAEVHICRELCDITKGRYAVAMDESHFLSLLLHHAPPPPVPPDCASASLIRMGFPRRAASESATSAAICACHMALKLGGTFTCPLCKAHICDLPTECRVCGLTLVSAPQLARSYHHLFPVPPFTEVFPSDAATKGQKTLLRVGDVGPYSSQAMVNEGQPLPAQCFGCMSPLPKTATGEESSSSGMRLSCQLCQHHFCFDCDEYIHHSLHNCPGCEAQQKSDRGPGS